MTDPWIQRHLRRVVHRLRATPATSPGTASRRAALLDRLERYAEAGRFPRWDRPVARRRRRHRPPRCFEGPGPRAPRFRDHEGTWCAVGHLMAATDPALADAVAERFEPCWLAEIDDPRLAAWAADHGFTLAELAWIQPGYCWTPPVCDEVVLEEAVQPTETTCEGADPRFQYQGGAVADFCQTCDGPFTVHAWVENPGTEPVTDLAVELWGAAGVVDRAAGLAIQAGTAITVELSTDSVEDVGTGGGLRLVAGADCDPAGDEVVVWDQGNGGIGWVLPEECGGGCPSDTGLGAGGDCGRCATGPGTPWSGFLPGLALGAALLRRRREPAA